MSKSLPKHIVKDLIQEKFIKSLAEVSNKTEVSPLVQVLISKVLNNLTKNSETLQVALIFVRDLNLTPETRSSLIQTLFTQYLNIEKSKFVQVSSNFNQILRVFYQVHGDEIIDSISKTLSLVNNYESKQKLYNLISQGFSSMPFDSNNDLPLVLALAHSKSLIRKSALMQVQDVNNVEDSVKALIVKEKELEVLSVALDLELPASFVEVLMTRLEEFLGFPLIPEEICKKLFIKICKFQLSGLKSARLILRSYDSPSLRELVTVALQSSTYPLFTGYNSEDLSIFLKKKLLNHWIDSFESILELLDCPLIFSLLPEIFEEIIKTTSTIPSLIQVAGGIFTHIISNSLKDLSPVQSIIRSLPSLKNLNKTQARLYQTHLLNILTYAIPLSPDTCKEILAKEFSEFVLETLSKLASPEALHLASCVTFHSDSNKSFLYILPFLLTSLTKSVEFRTSALISIEQFIQKSLPEVKVEFPVSIPEAFKIDFDLANLHKFLKKILRFRAGILQDPELAFYCMGKVKTNKIVQVLAVGVQAKDLDKNLYLKLLRPIKSDILTEALISNLNLDEDEDEILKRLEFYTSWTNFAYTEFLVKCLSKPELRSNVLKVLTPARFYKLSAKDKVLDAVFEILPSEQVKDYIESLDLTLEILIERLEKMTRNHQIESVLQILQGRPASAEVVRCLIQMLKKQEIEDIQDMLLVTIRIHGSLMKVSQNWLDDIAEVMFKSNSIETKKSALLALSSFHPDTSAAVIGLIEKVMINIVSIEEYSFFKSVLWKFEGKDIGHMVRRLLIYSFEAKLGLKEGENIVKCAGKQYLHVFIDVYSEYGPEAIFESISEFEAEIILISFDKLLATEGLKHSDLIIYTFGQEKFVLNFSKSTKNLPELLSSLFLNIFTIIVEDKKPENYKKSKESLEKLSNLLKSIEKAVNEKTLESTFFFVLQDNSYLKTKEAVEFLLPHVQHKPNNYFSLISPLCEIIETHASKSSSLKSEKMHGLAVYIQTVFSLLYMLLKFYLKTADILVMFANSILAFINCGKLEVRCAACLCFSTFFKEKNIDILPFISNFVEKSMGLCENSNETIKNSGFTCLIESLKTSDEFLSPYIPKIIEVYCKSANKHLGRVLIKHVSNRFIIDSLTATSQSLLSSPEPLQNFFNLTKKVFEKIPQDQVAGYRSGIFSYFKQILASLSSTQSKVLKKINESLARSFAAFALNLKNSQLKPGLLELYTWSIEKSEEGPYDYSRIFLFTSIISAMTQSLKKHFVSYYVHFIDLIYEVLEDFSSSYSTKKRKRNKGKLLRLSNTEVLSCVEGLALHDNERFLSSARHEKLAELISAQFRCIYLKDFNQFCQDVLVPRTSKILANCKDLAMWQSFTTRILFNARSSSADVRFHSLSFVSKTLALIGKEYAGLVGDIMPYVIQGLEDTEDQVMVVSKTLMSQLETYCGEEIHDYMS